jgi:cytochrome c oxidase assembly protein subunit 15
MNTVLWVRRLALAGVALCLVVVVLGAYVRLTAAGLGCPDWPGCYGHLTPLGVEANPESAAAFPDSEYDAGKAWREMIHRYAATTLGLIIVIIAAFAVRARRGSVVRVPLALTLLATVVFQGILGALTVTWQLKPLIVTLHLLFGLTTLALLAWLWLELRPRARIAPESAPAIDAEATTVVGSEPAGRAARTLAAVGFVALGVQIALGGWTSSNYAAVACPDFPRCQGEWVPPTNYANAFVVWRGLGVNYEGGVLDHSARVAIHYTHRLGAIVASLALIVAALVAIARVAAARAAGLAVLGALILQLLIGIYMIWRGFPLWLATAHNAGAALLVLATVALNHRLAR